MLPLFFGNNLLCLHVIISHVALTPDKGINSISVYGTPLIIQSLALFHHVSVVPMLSSFISSTISGSSIVLPGCGISV